MIDELFVVAESEVHRGRRLLVGQQGTGYIQLENNTMPLPLSPREFDRLRAMPHYRKAIAIAQTSVDVAEESVQIH